MNFFTFGFLKFGLVDAVDIGLVSFVTYKLLSLMKGTRSAQILTGLFLVIAVSFLAFWFQLEAVKWLITNIATVGLLVLVVLFQPEIRGALAQIGHNRVVRLFYKYEEQKSLDEIVRATQKLAESKTGSLIVLERQVGLKSYIESGRLMHAQVSEELLITIFSPRAPLHDGAVIIRGDLVVAAGCTLPLSRTLEFTAPHGMRHKAATGITEESDAIAVAVSEETGEISVAGWGRLERGIDPHALRDHLVRLLRSQ